MMPPMTTHKFQELCSQVLVPMIGDLLHRELESIQGDIDILAGELARLGTIIDRKERSSEHV